MSVASDKNLLLVFERKILRMIFGPVCDSDGWGSRFNDELYQMYRDKNIISKIHQQQKRWLGHAYRMQENDPPRRIAFGKVDGRRRQGSHDFDGWKP